MESALLLNNKKLLSGEGTIIVPANVPTAIPTWYSRQTPDGWNKLTLSISGGPWGTTWGNGVTGDSALYAALSHCFMSDEDRRHVVGKPIYIYFKMRKGPGQSGYPSLTRNGVTSSSWGAYADTAYIDEFVYTNVNGQIVGTKPFEMIEPITDIIFLTS